MCKQRHMLHLLSVSKAGNRAECQVGPTPFNVYYPGSEHTLPIRSKLCSCLSFIQKAWLMEDLGVLKGVQTSMRLKPERFLKYFCRHVHVRVSSYYIYNYRSFWTSFKEGVTLYSRRHKLCLWWMRLKSNFSVIPSACTGNETWLTRNNCIYSTQRARYERLTYRVKLNKVCCVWSI